MNAKGRRKTARARQLIRAGVQAETAIERSVDAEAAVVRGQEVIANLDAQLSAVTVERNDLTERVKKLVTELDDAQLGQGHLLRVCGERAVEIERLEKEVAKLRTEDHDTGKLRRRLADRCVELALAHKRIQDMEATARAERRLEPLVMVSERRAGMAR